MWNRICNLVLATLAVCLLVAFPAGALASGDIRPPAAAFLRELKIETSLAKKLLDRLLPLGRNFFSVVRGGRGVYSLALIPIPRDEEPDVAAELEAAMLDVALLRAEGRLAFSLGQGGVDRKLYRYDDPLGVALYSWYARGTVKIRGIQSAADALDAKGGGRVAAALAWLSTESAAPMEEDVPPPGALNDDYCRSLYRDHARALFEAGRYAEALPAFKNIHDLRWADVGAYLDAAECFLRTGEPGECLKLLRELRATLDEKMGTDDLARAGRLFREAGDRGAAFDAFRAARQRYREGR